jgi:hypothetical protein
MRKQYEYLPQEQIDSITTTKGKVIESEDILDGAHIKLVKRDKPATKSSDKKSKRWDSVAKNIMKKVDKIWDDMDIQSGSQIYADEDLQKKYIAKLADIDSLFLSSNNKEKTLDYLTDWNYHNVRAYLELKFDANGRETYKRIYNDYKNTLNPDLVTPVFKKGGTVSKTMYRSKSLNEKAEELVGSSTWNALDAVEKADTVAELVSEGVLAIPYAHGGEMEYAKGGGVGEIKKFKVGDKVVYTHKGKFGWEDIDEAKHNGYDLGINEVTEVDYSKGEESIKLNYDDFWVHPNHFELSRYKYAGGGGVGLSKNDIEILGVPRSKISEKEWQSILRMAKYQDGATFIFKDEKGLDVVPQTEYEWYIKEKYAKGGGVAEIPKSILQNAKKSALRDGYNYGIYFNKDTNEFSFSRLSMSDFYDKDIEPLVAKVITVRKAGILSVEVEKYAKGGGVAEAKYKVSFEIDGTKKEKMFDSKEKADAFVELMSDEDDVKNLKLEEQKESKKEAKTDSLFGMAKSAPPKAASKKEKESVQVNGIASDIARYDELKEIINNAKAEQELIGGSLKQIGKQKFLELYERRDLKPDNFNLSDADEKILFIVMDKYKKVEPEKAAILESYDGLLETTTTYSFNPEVLERIGATVSKIIMESKLLSDEDKRNLLISETTTVIKKGSIDRLMQYDDPAVVFDLIEPILALK